MAYEISITAHARVRAEFERALDAAVPAYELGQLGLFNEDIEGYIKKEVDRKLYEPKLPNAGDRERKWVERLEKLAGMSEWSGSRKAFFAAGRVKALLPKEPWNPGKYYQRTPLTIRNGKAEFEWLQTLRDINEAEKQWERKWFAELLLGGLPEEVSNFRIECLYLLRMPDGHIERRVRLVNILGESSGEINLDSKAFASPEKFRDYCLGWGNFAWSGNQTALQALHADICAEGAWKMINLVVTLGWMPLEAKPRVLPDGTDALVLDGVHFMGDCTYRNGIRLELNEGCNWISHKDEAGNDLPAEGYQVADEGRENPFFHKKPRLKPDVRITDVKLHFAAQYDPPNRVSGGTMGLPSFEKQKAETGKADKRPEGAADKEDGGSRMEDGKQKSGATKIPQERKEAILMARFFREVCCRLKAVCGEAANSIIGSVLSYAVAPEVFHKYSLFPGLMVHGSANSGKSTIMEWMMEFYGMSTQQGMTAVILRGNNSTPTGLLQLVDQYSNLPVWLDEFRAAEVGDDKKAVIHNFFNRGGQAKFSLSKLQRSVRTNALISGESTSSDAALRSRMPHIQVAKTMRAGSEEEQKENYEWFCAHRQHFRLFGLWLLEHRSEFVELFFREFNRWDEIGIDQRLKIVHGVGYAAWRAMWLMLTQQAEYYSELFTAEETRSYRQWLLDHSARAALDVVSETNINVFWTDLLPAVKAGAIPANCFKLEYEPLEGPPGAVPDAQGCFVQGAWKSYKIYIEPDSLLAALQKELVKQRGNITLKKKDMRDQLAREEYWIPGALRKRFTRGGAGGIPCWGVAVDKHPLGYIPVEDDVYLHYRANKGEGDPRKGPLFELVEWILDHETEDEDEKQGMI